MSQKKAKFNIVDIIVIIVLIAGVAFVGVRMFGGQEPANAANPTTNTYHVTLFAECVPEEVAATLVPGSVAENASRNMDLGKLVDFTIGESVFYTADSKGNPVRTTKPGHVSVALVFELSGTEQPTGLEVGKFKLNIGHTMGVCCGLTEIEGYVQSISLVA